MDFPCDGILYGPASFFGFKTLLKSDILSGFGLFPGSIDFSRLHILPRCVALFRHGALPGFVISASSLFVDLPFSQVSLLDVF